MDILRPVKAFSDFFSDFFKTCSRQCTVRTGFRSLLDHRSGSGKTRPEKVGNDPALQLDGIGMMLIIFVIGAHIGSPCYSWFYEDRRRSFRHSSSGVVW